MIYTNDETDKAIRQRHYYVTVCILPIATIAIICGFIYWLSTLTNLDRADLVIGYSFSLTIAIVIYLFNRRNWLKMPDGTYYNIKGISRSHNVLVSEPVEYEAEYVDSKREKWGTVISGLLFTGASLFMGLNGTKWIILPITGAIFGLYFFYKGIKELLDKSAKLKLAKTGIWTNKLGFVHWDNVIKAQVIENKSGRAPQTILEIYLKGTVFEEAGQPDERLNLTEIEDKEYVEMVLDSLMSKYKESHEVVQ